MPLVFVGTTQASGIIRQHCLFYLRHQKRQPKGRTANKTNGLVPPIVLTMGYMAHTSRPCCKSSLATTSTVFLMTAHPMSKDFWMKFASFYIYVHVSGNPAVGANLPKFLGVLITLQRLAPFPSTSGDAPTCHQSQWLCGAVGKKDYGALLFAQLRGAFDYHHPTVHRCDGATLHSYSITRTITEHMWSASQG
jgi:hypothetical protein